jgi:hypothetical protein
MRRLPNICAATLVLTLAMVLLCACSKTSTTVNASQAQSSANSNGELHYKVPDGWVVEKPTSSMRAAQYRLPKSEGDPEDASLVLYYFGAGQGGSVSANIDRWVGQMQQPDGSSSKDKAKTENLTINGLKITTVDVSGTYTAAMSPGAEGHTPNGNYRLRAAVIETPKGNYFAKLLGPEKSVGRWDQSFSDYLKSVEFK